MLKYTTGIFLALPFLCLEKSILEEDMYSKKQQTSELPYEKFVTKGAQSLSDKELLAIIIRTGTATKSPLDIADEILSLQGSRKDLLDICRVSLEELMSISGIGQVKAVKIKCIAELSKRIAMTSRKEKLCFTNPQSIADYYMEQFRHLEFETVLLICLDNKSRLIEDYTISQGTINASLLSPREIFLKALRARAVFIIMLHNHPSGDPSPSKQDLLITKKIQEVSKMIEIPLIDHIIIGDSRYVSFKESGYM